MERLRLNAALLVATIAVAGASPSLARTARASIAPSMYVESCNLGCSGGAHGTQVSCSSSQIHVNSEIRVRFSHPVDPASVAWATFQIIDVSSGQVPTGTRFVDPSDPNTVVFQPSLAFDAAGDPVFGFEPNTIYRIFIPGASQGDPGPYIVSLDLPQLPNRSRMLCDVIANQGILSPGVAFCAGDGADPVVTTPCPCANLGASGRGCANSGSGNGGAFLYALGSISPDDVVLYSTRELPSASSIFLQGNQAIPAGATYGDGIRCVGGRVLRLGVKSASSGIAVYPSAGDPSITSRSAALGQPIPPGSTRYYQTWYEDPDPTFCASPAGDRWNVTNAVRVTW